MSDREVTVTSIHGTRGARTKLDCDAETPLGYELADNVKFRASAPSRRIWEVFLRHGCTNVPPQVPAVLDAALYRRYHVRHGAGCSSWDDGATAERLQVLVAVVRISLQKVCKVGDFGDFVRTSLQNSREELMLISSSVHPDGNVSPQNPWPPSDSKCTAFSSQVGEGAAP